MLYRRSRWRVGSKWSVVTGWLAGRVGCTIGRDRCVWWGWTTKTRIACARGREEDSVAHSRGNNITKDGTATCDTSSSFRGKKQQCSIRSVISCPASPVAQMRRMTSTSSSTTDPVVHTSSETNAHDNIPRIQSSIENVHMCAVSPLSSLRTFLPESRRMYMSLCTLLTLLFLHLAFGRL